MSSTLSADQKVNMSLDDIVKHKTTEAKKASASKQSVSKQNNKKGVKPTKKGADKNGKKTVPNAKVAQSVGAAKAKRGANINQRRGLNQNGKASKAEVNTAIRKASQPKRAPRPVSARPAPAALAKAGQLKISFKPKELSRTTEKTVSQQIRAVMAKVPTPRNNGGSSAGNSRPASANRSVITAGGSRGAARGNPKGRGRTQR